MDTPKIQQRLAQHPIGHGLTEAGRADHFDAVSKTLSARTRGRAKAEGHRAPAEGLLPDATIARLRERSARAGRSR
jgi:hypothetical protein